MIKRIFTGLILFILVSSILLFSNNNITNIFLYSVVFFATIEWSKVNETKLFSIIFNGLFLIIFLLFITGLATSILNIIFINNFCYTATSTIIKTTPLWTLIFLFIFNIKKESYSKFLKYTFGFFIFINFTVAFLDIKYNFTNQNSYQYLHLLKNANLIKYQSGIIILSIILLTAINDSGAYFTGKLFGRHKLARNISPNKTIEGFVGGIILSLLFSSFLYYFLFNIEINFFNWILITLVLMVLGNLGDLFESKIKRFSNVKDSGNILPGHGGILDRIDSHLVVLPCFWFVMLFFIF